MFCYLPNDSVQHHNLIALSFTFYERDTKVEVSVCLFFSLVISLDWFCSESSMCQTNMKTVLPTTGTTPKRSTFHYFEEIVLPFEVISVCPFVQCSDVWYRSQMKMSLNLPQQIALAKYPTQVSAIIRVVIVTQLWCNSFVSSSPFLSGQLSTTYLEM